MRLARAKLGLAIMALACAMGAVSGALIGRQERAAERLIDSDSKARASATSALRRSQLDSSAHALAYALRDKSADPSMVLEAWVSAHKGAAMAIQAPDALRYSSRSWASVASATGATVLETQAGWDPEEHRYGWTVSVAQWPLSMASEPATLHGLSAGILVGFAAACAGLAGALVLPRSSYAPFLASTLSAALLAGVFASDADDMAKDNQSSLIAKDRAAWSATVAAPAKSAVEFISALASSPGESTSEGVIISSIAPTLGKGAAIALADSSGRVLAWGAERRWAKVAEESDASKQARVLGAKDGLFQLCGDLSIECVASSRLLPNGATLTAFVPVPLQEPSFAERPFHSVEIVDAVASCLMLGFAAIAACFSRKVARNSARN